MRPDGTAPKGYLEDQDDEHRITETIFAPHKAKDVLADYLEALGVHITTEIASKCSGTPINRFQKEVLLVVPDRWRDSLESEILQVGRPSL